MLKDSVEFTDLEVPIHDVLSQYRNQHQGIIPYSWARVRITIPLGFNESEMVKKWLAENTTQAWSINQSDDYHNSKTNVTVRFQNIDDALMFKLSDGYRSWENPT